MLSLIFAFCIGFCICARWFVPYVCEDKALKGIIEVLLILLVIACMGCYNI